jgi:copper chaperone
VRIQIEVENIHCGGCARTIEGALRKDARITEVVVKPDQSQVTIEAQADVHADAAATLARLGYPEKGSVEGVRAAAAKAKSLVSCAIGRLS